MDKGYIEGVHEGIKFAIKVLEETRDTMKACGFDPVFPNGDDFVEKMSFKLKILVYRDPFNCK